jgi:hypothetical protein
MLRDNENHEPVAYTLLNCQVICYLELLQAYDRQSHFTPNSKLLTPN